MHKIFVVSMKYALSEMVLVVELWRLALVFINDDGKACSQKCNKDEKNFANTRKCCKSLFNSNLLENFSRELSNNWKYI